MNTRMTAEPAEFPSSLASSKPVAFIEKILSAVQPWAERFILSKGNTLNYFEGNERQCYLLLSGSVSLQRRGDGIVLNSESSPFLLGVGNQMSKDQHMFVKILETSEIARIPLTRFNELVTEHNLWEQLTYMLIYTASRVYEHCTVIAQMSAYDIIRFQLVELMQESESVRNNITAANYITSRTYLSRSGTMRILSELRIGSYISMHRGILLGIHHLPQKY